MYPTKGLTCIDNDWSIYIEMCKMLIFPPISVDTADKLCIQVQNKEKVKFHLHNFRFFVY